MVSNKPDQTDEMVLNKVRPKGESRHFLSITFTNEELAGKTGYKQYDYTSPWVVPIQFIEKKQEAEREARMAVAMSAGDSYGFSAYAAMQNEQMVENMVKRVSGYRIELSKKVPDFKWYQKSFSDSYGTGRPTEKSSVDHPDFK